MRRSVLAALAALAIAGCAASGLPPTSPTSLSPTGSPVPIQAPTATPGPIPSKACGGYHIVIDNVGQSAIAVRINGKAITTVKPGGTADIAQFGLYSSPAMPWDVAATRVKDKALLFTAHLDNDGTDGRRVQVGDKPQGAAALTPFVC